MSGYRPGDRMTVHGPMRLTVGALAEMADALDAEGPQALASRLRAVDDRVARIVVGALLRGGGRIGGAQDVSDAEIRTLMPAASHCIVRALA